MNVGSPAKGCRGFSLLELMVAMAIFMIICAAMFSLLQLSQQKYSSESQLSASFQEARLAMDQMVRDINASGYPPFSFFSVVPASSASYAVSPVAWNPNYPTSSCLIGTGGGGTCITTPGDFDLIVETDLGAGVSWIRYQLVGTTLSRAVVPKSPGTNPLLATSAPGVTVPFLMNVMNNPPGTQLAQITMTYPSMFPGNQPLPIFQYTCDTPVGPLLCPNAGANGAPVNVRDVDITLVVMAPQRDVQTQTLKLVELNGRGHRVNPAD
jgi:prepilin-type N-terminal cleavage/methylation domain-containing protein